jgi:hypothetical protein
MFLARSKNKASLDFFAIQVHHDMFKKIQKVDKAVELAYQQRHQKNWHVHSCFWDIHNTQENMQKHICTG